MRKFLFWSHLILGVFAGLVIFVMSVTGVLLTYEKQMKEWEEEQYKVASTSHFDKLPVDHIFNVIKHKHDEEHHFYIRFLNDNNRAVPVWAGNTSYLVDPYSGEILREGKGQIAKVLSVVTSLHRWLGFSGKYNAEAKAVTAYANLIFFVLILSGLYLWLPRRWSLLTLKNKMLLKQNKNQRARHFNWHHVFGFWAIIPLFFIVLSATIFHFEWANKLLYGAFGEAVPKREKTVLTEGIFNNGKTYDYLFKQAQKHAKENQFEQWHSMWLEIELHNNEVKFFIDKSIGNDPTNAYALYLNTETGTVVKTKFNDDWSKGSQAWDVARFMHTGEYFGVIGQTIAGLASLAACFLVYTGFMLSWRRFLSSQFLTKVIKKTK